MTRYAWASVLLLCLSGVSLAGTLTETQYQALKTDITVTNQAEFATAVANNDDQVIANAYNMQASPVYWVWKTTLTDQQIYEITTADGTTWNWGTYMGQPQAQRDGWQTMYRGGLCNPSLPQTRTAWSAIFQGGGAAATQLTHLMTVGRREGLRVEALFVVVGSGNGSPATPSVMGFEGKISALDVAHALRGVPLI